MKRHSIAATGQSFHCPNPPPGTTAINPKTVVKIVDEMLAHQVQMGRSQMYLRSVKSRLGKFAAYFKGSLASVTAQDIEDYLQSLHIQARAINTTRSAIGGLFNFAKKRGYVPPCHPGVQWVERKRVLPAKPEFFTPPEMEVVLQAATPKAQLGLTLSAFAGLRLSEVGRLDWSDVNLNDGFIRVEAGKGSLRAVSITENLRDWLVPHRKESGLVVPQKNLIVMCRKAVAAAKIEWRPNGLRHSFLAHALALTKNIFQVASEAGLSPTVLKRHFLHVVPESAAKAWFSIRPTGLNPETSTPANPR